MAEQGLAPPLPVAPDLAAFYAEDVRRRRSREVDLGLRWRAREGSTYRAAWIVDTGEVYSVRHGEAPRLSRVTVLARLSGDALRRALQGWRRVCASDAPGTYEWLLARCRGAALEGPALQS